MLGPVELDAPGDPGAQQADQGRLDDVLAVDDVVAGVAVLHDVDAAADLRQQHDAQVLVLEMDGLPGARLRGVGDPVGDGVGVDAARRALVDAPLQEERVAVGLGEGVGVDDDGLGPGCHGQVALLGGSRRQLHHDRSGSSPRPTCARPMPSASLLSCHRATGPGWPQSW